MRTRNKADFPLLNLAANKDKLGYDPVRIISDKVMDENFIETPGGALGRKCQARVELELFLARLHMPRVYTHFYCQT